jgi:hypothetical protein
LGVFLCNHVCQARYILSPDKALTERGAISGIPYRNNFNGYKKILIKKANVSTIKDLHHWFTNEVFGSKTKTGLNGNLVLEDNGDDFEGVMRDLDLSDRDSDDLDLDNVLPLVSRPQASVNVATAATPPVVVDAPLVLTEDNPVTGGKKGKSRAAPKKAAAPARQGQSRKQVDNAIVTH